MIQVTSSEDTNLKQEEKKKYEWGKKEKIMGVIAILSFLLMIIVSNSGGNKPIPSSTTTIENQILSIGDEGIVNNNGDRNNCDGKVILGISKEAENQIIKASVANDEIGLANILMNGGIFFVPNCTKVKVIDINMFIRQVRILEGEQFGKSGWLPYEFVIK